MNIKRFIIFLAILAIVLFCPRLILAADPVKENPEPPARTIMPQPPPTRQELLNMIQYCDEHLRHIQTQRSVLDYDEMFTRDKRDQIRKQIADLIAKEGKDKKAPAEAGKAEVKR